MSSRVPCAPSNMTRAPSRIARSTTARGIGEHRHDALRQGLERLDDRLHLRHLAAERSHHRRPGLERDLDALGQPLQIAQLAAADAGAAHLVLVRRTDALLRGAERARSGLAQAVDRDVVRQDQVRAVADAQPLLETLMPAPLSARRSRRAGLRDRSPCPARARSAFARAGCRSAGAAPRASRRRPPACARRSARRRSARPCRRTRCRYRRFCLCLRRPTGRPRSGQRTYFTSWHFFGRISRAASKAARPADSRRADRAPCASRR